jgi:phosphate transport system substrate-binding protein
MALVAMVGMFAFAACGDDNGNGGGTAATTGDTGTTSNATAPATGGDTPATPPAGGVTGPIDVIIREAGSGTRGAFNEVLGIELDGVDRSYEEADIQTGTGAVIGAVAGNEHAIGYISLGALRDDVRAVPINGVEASAANVQNGTYPLYRNFYLAVPRDLSDIAQSFIDFIVAAEGQEIVGAGYIAIGTGLPSFTETGLNGSVVIEGSTSVVPLMERIAAAFMELNPDVDIQIHSTGSGAGITGAIEGRVDFGLSSRELRDTELESVDSVLMAHDGLAVIVHNANGVTSLSPEQVRDIFIGELSSWTGL